MQSNILTANIPMNPKPHSGEDAYRMMLQSLTKEIEERQSILADLKTDSIRKSFIQGWTPQTTTVDIHV